MIKAEEPQISGEKIIRDKKKAEMVKDIKTAKLEQDKRKIAQIEADRHRELQEKFMGQ